MNYKTIKTAAESPVLIEIVKRDSTIRAVVIGDLRIESDYGMNLSVAQPYEKVKRHRLTATIEGFGEKVLHFDNQWEASDDKRKLETAGATVVAEDVEVMIDDAGQVVQDVSARPAVADDYLVPF